MGRAEVFKAARWLLCDFVRLPGRIRDSGARGFATELHGRLRRFPQSAWRVVARHEPLATVAAHCPLPTAQDLLAAVCDPALSGPQFGADRYQHALSTIAGLLRRFLALRDPLRRFLALRRLFRRRALRRLPLPRLMSSTRRTTL